MESTSTFRDQLARMVGNAYTYNGKLVVVAEASYKAAQQVAVLRTAQGNIALSLKELNAGALSKFELAAAPALESATAPMAHLIKLLPCAPVPPTLTINFAKKRARLSAAAIALLPDGTFDIYRGKSGLFFKPSPQGLFTPAPKGDVYKFPFADLEPYFPLACVKLTLTPRHDEYFELIALR